MNSYQAVCETCGKVYNLFEGVYLNYQWRCKKDCHKVVSIKTHDLNVK